MTGNLDMGNNVIVNDNTIRNIIHIAIGDETTAIT